MSLFTFSSSVPDFREPIGQNFRIASDDGVSISELATCLQSVVGFLHSAATSDQLLQYDDWWQHDGCHFPRAIIDFPKLSTMIESPAAIQRCTSDDFMVNVGIVPPDFTWYLRWYLDDEDRSIGGFDITIPSTLVDQFESTARRTLVPLIQEDSVTYYARIRQ